MIRKVVDLETILGVRCLIEPLMGDFPWYLNPSWIASRGWQALCLRGTLDDAEETLARRLSNASARLSCTDLLAVLTDPPLIQEIFENGQRYGKSLPWEQIEAAFPAERLNIEYCLKLSNAVDEITEVARNEFATLNFVVVPGNLEFAFLNTSEMYSIATGPPEFIQEMACNDIELTWKDFQDFYESVWGPVEENALSMEAIYKNLPKIIAPGYHPPS